MPLTGARSIRLTRLAIAMLIALIAPVGLAGAQSSDLPVGDIIMPPVTPEAAARYLGARDVPSAAVVPVVRLQAVQGAASGLVKLDVAPMLGHDLPTDAVTAAGFQRADFARQETGKLTARALSQKTTPGSTGSLGSPMASEILRGAPGPADATIATPDAPLILQTP